MLVNRQLRLLNMAEDLKKRLQNRISSTKLEQAGEGSHARGVSQLSLACLHTDTHTEAMIPFLV